MTVKKNIILIIFFIAQAIACEAQQSANILSVKNTVPVLFLLFILIALMYIIYLLRLSSKFKEIVTKQDKWFRQSEESRFKSYLKELRSDQITKYLELKKAAKKTINPKIVLALIFLSLQVQSSAQTSGNETKETLGQPGIIITIILLLMPVLLGSVFAINRAIKAYRNYSKRKNIDEARKFALHLSELDDKSLDENLEKRKSALEYTLTNTELSGSEAAEDSKGIITNVSAEHEVHFTALKKKAAPRPSLDKDISKLIIWHIGCAAFWLALGGFIGEYVGIKFVAPDTDHVSWLSFGRLRPVHTNMVFWGWASLGIIGLGYYVVPTVSNTKIYSLKWGWISLILINAMVILGSLSLMAGVNNGGGEFREYIWPITLLFAIALILTAANFIKTVARRTTQEIYISNWYIISAILFTIVIASTAYLPFWQDGIGETIIQGYYMHSGVGMWFTLYTLGLLYYFIPQQLNRPIYAYSLGILAFWTQILFYTIIGTHHFVFSAIPWWLQTIAIVGSGGMIIPVVAATINYFMTFKGQWKKVSNSYTLPFFFVAAMYYFIVSMQGTAEAFKFTNLLWHFTDFTVGHSHLGFYGIITFAIWGGVYTIMPRLTGKEPPQHVVGAHFWLAFVGLLFYVIPISIGGTLKGLMWMDHKPFIDSVAMMFDFWLWRAIGGSLMFISHLVFAYNFYKMIQPRNEDVDIKEVAIKHLESIIEKN